MAAGRILVLRSAIGRVSKDERARSREDSNV